jgi:diacylglycerol kinase
MKAKEFSFKDRTVSFRFAFRGVKRFFSEEHNAWIHLFATLMVFAGVYYFRVSGTELVLLILVTGFVWAAEIFNTAIEKIMDFISPERNETVKHIKDMSAAAVLVAAVTALVTGSVIFIPKII